MTDSLTFEHPRAFWLLLVVAAMTGWAVLQHVRRQRMLARLGEGPVLARLLASFSPRRAAVRIALVGGALALSVLALARPHYGVRETEVSNAGIDIAIVVDASKSMLVKDVVPTRLQGTVLEVRSLLQRMAGGRVALVPFAGIPFVQCPLTTDRDVIMTYLGDLKPEDVPVGGTNIGRALAMAADVLTGEKERVEAEQRDNLVPQFKGSKHKAIILFSDGEDHEGAAIEAAQKAAEKGIRVFTVGVGSAFGDPVPVLAPDGSATGVLKDESGNPVFSKLDMDLLQKVAAATGGKAFHYGGKSVAQDLFAALDQLEKAEYSAQFQQSGEDRFQWLLGPALLLLLADAAVTNRRRARREPKVALRRQPQRKTATSIALLLLVALSSMAAGLMAPQRAFAVPTWLEHENGDIHTGRGKMTEKKFGEALKSFQDAQASRPEHVVIWYDIALAQAALGAWQDAVTSLARALGGMRQSDAAIEADIHFATGTTQLSWARQLEAKALATKPPAENKAAGQDPTAPAPGAAPDDKPAAEKKVPDATEDPLPHYRAAVTSLEQSLLADPKRAETRRNLEIARMGAYPPCRNRDKKDEPNDQVPQATPVKFAAGQHEQVLDQRACPEDRDLFQIKLEAGDRFSAKLALKADATPVQESEGGTPAPAKLGLAVLSGNGAESLRPLPVGAPPVDAVDLGRVDQAMTVLVDVRNIAEVETAYDVTLKLLPACQRIEDEFEPNDSPRQARAVTLGQPLKGRLCPQNDDDFAVPLQQAQGLMVRVKSKVDAGADKVELDILDPAGQVVAHGRPGKEGMAARLAYAGMAGAYVVQVRGGPDTEADYDLAIEVLPPCAARDDRYEDNDQAVQANPLDASMLQTPMDKLQLCPGDDDWYAVELKQGESLFVDLQAAVEDLPDAQDLAGALTVEVYDERGVQWGNAVGGPVTGGALMRTAAVLAPPPGRYRVRVTGGGVEKPSFPLPELPPGSVQMSQPTVNAAPPPGPGQPQAPQGPGITATPRPGSLPPGLALPPGQGQPSGMPGQAQGMPGQPPGQTAPPALVPHVVLPAGWPQPKVDLAAAKLDVPYQLKLRILPPCPAGNDEFEPDDTAGEAKPFEVGQEALLRICKGDQDWLQVTQKAGQDLQVSARYDLSHGTLALDVYDEAGTTAIAKGERQGPDSKPVTGDDTPEARKGRTAVTAVKIPKSKAERVVKLRMSADKDVENFYVLRVEEPPPPSDDGKKDQQDQDDKDKEQDKKDQDKKDKDKKDKPEDKKPDEEEKQRLKQQMQRNDHDPHNLEALEAQRKSQFRNEVPAKDW